MSTEKRFSQDFTQWSQALKNEMRLMIEDNATGVEHYVELYQIIEFFLAGGNVVIITPPLNDSSTKIATTEFVQKNLNQSSVFGNIFIDEYKLAGHQITTGNNNVGIGTSALAWTGSGSFNVAFGWLCLSSNTSGSENSAFGRGCLWKHPNSNRNNAFGRNALYELLSGSENIGIGAYAGTNLVNGALCNSLWSSILIGNNTRPKSNNDINEIIIGHNALGEGSNTAVLGNTAIVKTFLRGQIDVKAASPVLTGGSISIYGGTVEGVFTNFRAFAPGDILHASFNLFNENTQEWEPFEGFFTIQSIPDNTTMYVSDAGSLEVSGITDFSISRTSATKAAIDTFMGSHKMIGAEFNVNASVVPQYDSFYNLGNSVRRFNQVFATTGSIQTSDARLKTPVRPFTTDEMNAARQLSKEIGIFQFLQSVAEKGEDARMHIGLTVQRAIEVMQANNLDPFAYGFICYDEWETITIDHSAVEGCEAHTETIEIDMPDGTKLAETVEYSAIEAREAYTETVQEAGSRYSFRYDQLNLFIAAGIEARLTALENE